MKKILSGLVLAACCTAASATTYNVTMVLSGGGGFGASLFHDASGANVMSGNTVGTITNISGMLGTYDDVTGAFFADLDVVPVVGTDPTSFTLTGTLLFDGAGVLASNSSLAIDFSPNAISPMTDGNIGFLPGYVCCGSTDNDPNSFLADTNGNLIMSLWGANFSSGLPFDGTYDNKTNLGMDLRIKLEPVPVPAAVWLFGSGLMGLVAVSRRRKLSV